MSIIDSETLNRDASARFLGVSLSTHDRLEKLDPDFPRAFQIRGRPYRTVEQLRAYRQILQERPPRPPQPRAPKVAK
jgi:hypothetical protein